MSKCEKCADLERENARLRRMFVDGFDVQRVIDWQMNEGRKEAVHAFTAGGERTCAYCIEEEARAHRGRIRELEQALANLIPWAGESPEGPSWATPEAKARNREMCEKAIQDACDCFPEKFDSRELSP